jgi:hypothetical protein
MELYKNYLKEKEDRLNRSLSIPPNQEEKAQSKMHTIVTRPISKLSPAEHPRHNSRNSSKGKVSSQSKQANAKTMVKKKEKISERLAKLEKVCCLFSSIRKYRPCNI